MPDILETLKQAGYSADNIAFGSGGGLLQKLNRDTMKFAFKCSSIMVNDEERDVFKQPITDRVKNSKKGRLKLVNYRGTHGQAYATVESGNPMYDQVDDSLETVFENGVLLRDQTFDDRRYIAVGGLIAGS